MVAMPELDTTPSKLGQRPLVDVALISAFAALIAACALVGGIPTGSGVDITLQTFGVMLAGCVLGPIRGFLSVCLYLVLGGIGLPIFSEHKSGFGVFSGVSAGYLFSFPVAAAIAGFLVAYVARRERVRAWAVFLCSAAGSILIIHPFGIVGIKLWANISLHDAILADRPFWVGDVLKTALVAIVASEVHRAFPALLERRRPRLRRAR
jgi:biotin transport system substrate-specific component